MQHSPTASILSYLKLLHPTGNRCKMEKQQKSWWTKISKPLLATQILLLSTTPLFIASSALVSIAAQKKIAQVNPADSISRPTLKVGSQGERVSELQAALKLLGFYSGVVDGTYSENTANAVSRFKQAAGLNPDGIVDATTWQRLFPREPIVASTVPTSGQGFNSATNFPVPTQTTSLTNVTNPSPPRQAATQAATKPNPPRQAVTQAATKPNPPKKPVTQTATKPNPPKKPVTQTATSPEPRPANPRQTQKTPKRTTSTTRTQSTTRSGQTTRTQSNTSTKRTPGIQYTSEGLPILRIGLRGSEVVKLQQQLKKLGYLKGDVDGDFGVTTEAAVKAVQKRYGLEPDGIAGGATWEILLRR